MAIICCTITCTVNSPFYRLPLDLFGLYVYHSKLRNLLCKHPLTYFSTCNNLNVYQIHKKMGSKELTDLHFDRVHFCRDLFAKQISRFISSAGKQNVKRF